MSKSYNTVVRNFELDTLNAAETVFPKDTRSGCLFPSWTKCLSEHLEFGDIKFDIYPVQ